MEERHDRTAVIVDEHPLWLDALQNLLERLDVRVVGRATRWVDAERLLLQHRPDVLIGDFAAVHSGEGADALLECDLLLRAREANPQVKCIVLSEEDDANERERAFSAGASAFCVKRAEREDVAAAIRQAFDPSIYLASTIRAASAPPASPREMLGSVSVTLTKREVEILRLAAEGHSNSQLARMLWVTEQTVKFHLSNIYRKLDVSNRTEASRWAQIHGLLAATPSAAA